MVKRKLNQKFPYLIVVAIVAVVSIASLVLNSGENLEGAQVVVSEEERVKHCVDTDPSNDRDTAGYAQVGLVKYDDFCNGDVLYQFYCDRGDNVRPTRSFQCENGCRKGACQR